MDIRIAGLHSIQKSLRVAWINGKVILKTILTNLKDISSPITRPGGKTGFIEKWD